MSWPLLVGAVLLPFLFWAAHHYYHDRHRPEPVANLILTVGLGAAASLAAGFVGPHRDHQSIQDALVQGC